MRRCFGTLRVYRRLQNSLFYVAPRCFFLLFRWDCDRRRKPLARKGPHTSVSSLNPCASSCVTMPVCVQQRQCKFFRRLRSNRKDRLQFSFCFSSRFSPLVTQSRSARDNPTTTKPYLLNANYSAYSFMLNLRFLYCYLCACDGFVFLSFLFSSVNNCTGRACCICFTFIIVIKMPWIYNF